MNVQLVSSALRLVASLVPDLTSCSTRGSPYASADELGTHLFGAKVNYSFLSAKGNNSQRPLLLWQTPRSLSLTSFC